MYNLKILPKNHREDFFKKLKSQKKPKLHNYLWLKVAAIFIIGLVFIYPLLKKETIEKPSQIIAQVEAEYLSSIETEWRNFLAITNDEKLIKRFEKKLDELDADYKEISKAFKIDTNNILILESLVDNLQTRLKILKDIQEHIKILNQKNEQHENTI